MPPLELHEEIFLQRMECMQLAIKAMEWTGMCRNAVAQRRLALPIPTYKVENLSHGWMSNEGVAAFALSTSTDKEVQGSQPTHNLSKSPQQILEPNGRAEDRHQAASTSWPHIWHLGPAKYGTIRVHLFHGDSNIPAFSRRSRFRLSAFLSV